MNKESALANLGLSGNEDTATVARVYGERLSAVQEQLVKAQTDADRGECQTKLSELVEAYEFVTQHGPIHEEPRTTLRRPCMRTAHRAGAAPPPHRHVRAHGAGRGAVEPPRDRRAARAGRHGQRLRRARSPQGRRRRDQGAAPGPAVQHRGEGALPRRGESLLQSVASEHRARARRRRERQLLLLLDGAAEGPQAAPAHRGLRRARIASSPSTKSPTSRAS